MNYPSALLLDEPLGALDLKLRQAMQLELKRIQREVGITFIFVTHDQEEALTMSDRIAVMNEGRVEQIGSPEEIYHEPDDGVRRRLHRHGEPAPGHDHRSRGRRSRSRRVRETGSSARPAVEGLDAGDAGDADDPARAHAPPGRRAGATASRPVPAEVVDLVFQGPVVRFDLRAVDGSSLVAHVGPDDDLPLLRPGDRVWAVLGAGGGTAAAALGARRRPDPELEEIESLKPVITRSDT